MLYVPEEEPRFKARPHQERTSSRLSYSTQHSPVPARLSVFGCLTFCFLLVSVWSYFWPVIIWALLPITGPVIGHLRYFFESIRPEIQQYFVESDTNGTPISREFRALVYQRAKKERDTRPFGTLFDVYKDGYEWVNHSMRPVEVVDKDPRVTFGGPDCTRPYTASHLNISAMSYGALSKNAILALNKGAKMGGFAHNTGEGGISPYHEKYGGDLIWQIGTGYFGCRDANGRFNAESFAAKAKRQQVKMIELKIRPDIVNFHHPLSY